ncbi:MAG: 50S ribosomal protein L21 [Bdellovibrionales bacterium]|nr:50S ribosomal protein L21 [Bdellovibrionales bacterium]
MYAIIRSGGKQYKVQPGDVVRLEKLEADLGQELQITEVLAISGDSMIVGEPIVKDAKVTLVVTNQKKAPKIIIFKKKRRQGYRRLTGHRQPYTEVFVKSISGPSGEVSAETRAQVFDPIKKQERAQRKAEYFASLKKSPAKHSGTASTAGSNVETTKKAVGTRTATKKAAVKAKSPAKKVAAKKKAATASKTAKATKKTVATKKKAATKKV